MDSRGTLEHSNKRYFPIDYKLIGRRKNLLHTFTLPVEYDLCFLVTCIYLINCLILNTRQCLLDCGCYCILALIDICRIGGLYERCMPIKNYKRVYLKEIVLIKTNGNLTISYTMHPFNLTYDTMNKQSGIEIATNSGKNRQCIHNSITV